MADVAEAAAAPAEAGPTESSQQQQPVQPFPGSDAAGCGEAAALTLGELGSLLHKPFGDVLQSICAALQVRCAEHSSQALHCTHVLAPALSQLPTTKMQLKSTAPAAAEQLRYLLHHSGPERLSELLASPLPVTAMLVALVKSGPGMPAAGAAMHVLSMLALCPAGRTGLRLDGALPPAIRCGPRVTVAAQAARTPAIAGHANDHAAAATPPLQCMHDACMHCMVAGFWRCRRCCSARPTPTPHCCCCRMHRAMR